MPAEFLDRGLYFETRYSGLRTYDRVLDMLGDALAHAEAIGVYRILFDLRGSEEGFSVAEKYDLGLFLAKAFGTRFRVAALLHAEQITGFLENVSQNRGAIHFRVAHDEKAVREWLSGPG